MIWLIMFCAWLFQVALVCCGADVLSFGHTQEFYFIRHGQTDHNSGKNTTTTYLPLNQTGKLQIQAATIFIQQLMIKTICYSPLLRARQTKDIIVADHKIVCKRVANLQEGSLKDWQELQKVRGHNLKISKRLEKFLNRVTQGLEVALSYPSPVLIVSHGGVYSALCRILNINTSMWALANGSIAHFYQRADRWHVRLLANFSTELMYDNYMPEQ